MPSKEIADLPIDSGIGRAALLDGLTHCSAGNSIRVTQKIPAVADQSVDVTPVQEKLPHADRPEIYRRKWFVYRCIR